ncbi:MAG: hypothetical protein V1779_02920 [bacterium]
MRTLIIFFIAFILIITACDDSTTNNNSNSKQISATVNGNKFTASSILIAEEFGTHLKKLKILGISGTDSIIVLLCFEPFDSIKTGTYSITKDGYFLGIYNHSGISDTATEGTVKVDKFVAENPIKASGTFNFKIKYNETVLYTISNGIFNSGD